MFNVTTFSKYTVVNPCFALLNCLWIIYWLKVVKFETYAFGFVLVYII